MPGKRKSTKLLREQFSAIKGLPCWGPSQGFGSFITLNFGQPHLEVREASMEAGSLVANRHRATVYGDHQIWIEQCDWRFAEGEQNSVSSGSERSLIEDVLMRLEGQILKQVQVDPEGATSRFQFESGTAIQLVCYPDFQPDDPLWHLYAPSSVVTFVASGELHFGPRDDPNPEVIDCEEILLTL